MARKQLRDTHPELLSEVAAGQDAQTVGGYAPASGQEVEWQCSLGHKWNAKIVYRTSGSGCPVCANRVILVGFNDLATTRPDLTAEWHPTKNSLTPQEVVAGSGKKIWWECNKGHQWFTTVLSRTSGTGCKECHKVAVKEGSMKGKKGATPLAVSHPAVAAQWGACADDKNATASRTSAGSHKEVVWQGVGCGHSWTQQVTRRVESFERGVICGVCDGRIIQEGVNDLFAKQPHLLTEWDVAANGGEAPRNIAETTPDAYWWKCSKGHSWEAPVVKRTLGQGCPVCAGKVVISGYNDLATVSPTVASEWHATKNGKLTPAMVTVANGNKAWWQCKKGHEWEAVIASRIDRNCPVCGNRRIISGINDLTTLSPAIAAEWHPTKNGTLKPTDVTLKGGVWAWWMCKKGHDWQAVVADRADGHGCPRCVTRISKGEQEVIDFVKNLNIGTVMVSASQVGVLPGKQELDIYIPSRKFAIEFNGTYFHSTRFAHASPKRRHYEKFVEAKKSGVELLQIWEDEWTTRRPIVERMIRRKLGVSQERPVNARQTIAGKLLNVDARAFLDSNHIQGYHPSSTYLGLTDTSGTVVAALGFRKDGGQFQITRYATSANVRGGFTKLLSALRKMNPESPVYTFSDNCVSDGRLYEATGFSNDKELPPDYMYVVKGRTRVHKFNYRIARFKNDPSLQYKEGLTEAELALLNNLHPIWDAGKVKWLLK